MQQSTSHNAVSASPIAGLATTAGKQVCIYEAAQQAFPAAPMRALEAMTAALRARIQHVDPDCSLSRRIHEQIDPFYHVIAGQRVGRMDRLGLEHRQMVKTITDLLSANTDQPETDTGQ